MDESFLDQVYAIVLEIPRGKVATYGQIACLSGHDSRARMVGKALKMSSFYGDFPCHRVVNHQGKLVVGWVEQAYLLRDEGVFFLENGIVDLKKSQWESNNN